MRVVKKDLTTEEFSNQKIVNAVNKSASRAMVNLSSTDYEKIIELVWDFLINENLDDVEECTVEELHNAVEAALEEFNPKVAKSYKDYRNYKKDFIHMMDKVYENAQKIRYLGDKDNANTDSALVATKRSLIFNALNKELYQKFFMTTNERQACKDGYIYIHDMSARLDTMNCCLFRAGEVMKNGFEMGNVWYNEPKTLDTAFDVIGDIILSTAAQQYGGFTIPEIDKILSPYAEKSYNKYYEEFIGISNKVGTSEITDICNEAKEYALDKVRRDFKQGWQGIEYKLNTVGSSRGDYPFVTMTFGLDTSVFGKMASITFLNVHKNGQGKDGFKRPVLFPKLVFLYDKNLHGKGCINEDVFNAGIECSMKTMYPDWLSLTGDGYVSEMYKKYGRIVSPMGCVDGEEIITYKFNNNLYVESFKRMWERIAREHPDKGQSNSDDIHRIIDLTSANVLIYDTLKGFVKIKYLIRNVQDNWCDVTLSQGRILRTTTDHPFETKRGVVLAKDLTSNDKIQINRKQYSEDTIDNMQSDLAWLLGFMLCDGCYQNYSVFASIASEGEDDIEEAFKTIFNKYFGIMPKTVLQERGKSGKYKDLRVYSDGNLTLKSIIDNFTEYYGGVQKNNRHIPTEVFSYNEEAKYGFLAGMIDADGYINNTKKSIVQIGSVNKELALQQMALAQALGMEAKLYVNHYNKSDLEKIRYRVEFYPNDKLVEAMKCEKKKSKYKYVKPQNKGITWENVKSVKPLDIQQYSYDVTTESEHFEVSSVYSHNCRAFLSPWYERGGMYPEDENDKPVFEGRFNLGAISLHLPMILAKSRSESKDFYEVLDYYMEMIRGLHKRTYDYIGEMKASVNPLAYCEGGFYGGHLKPDEKIKSILKPMTLSFGVTALNELQELYNGKSIAEDGQFALEVMNYINNKITEYKEEDDLLYAIYGTPAESLCGLQIEQFRKKYGIINGVSDRTYVSNSFHCGVWEDITPIEKQDLENRFWNLFNGGKIQYCRYPIAYNKEAVVSLVRRAMDMGLYEGVNLSLSYCEDCGYEQLEMDVCPKCGSQNVTKIDRMNGYLGFTKVHGDTRYNKAKNDEIADRKSM